MQLNTKYLNYSIFSGLDKDIYIKPFGVTKIKLTMLSLVAVWLLSSRKPICIIVDCLNTGCPTNYDSS